MGLAVLCLLGGVVLLLAWPDLLMAYHYQPRTIALAHLFILGWLLTMAMGAAYQLVPVAMATALWSPRLARAHFAVHVTGLIWILWGFATWQLKQVGHGGSLLFLGALFFLVNVDNTMDRARRLNVVSVSIATALFWLLLTMLIGLLMSFDRLRPFLRINPVNQAHAHAHLGLLGFFLLLVTGVSYKLLAMFLVGPGPSRTRPWVAYGLLNAGLLGTALTTLAGGIVRPAFALVTALGIVGYLWEVAAMVCAGRRRPDAAPIGFLAALALLIPTAALGGWVSVAERSDVALVARLENAYGFLGLMGVLTLATLSMGCKIIPFLAWFHAYGPHLGRRPVPAAADLFLPGVLQGSLLASFAGVFLATTGMATANFTVLHAGLFGLGIGVLLFALNVANAFRHMARPRLGPEPVKMDGFHHG